MPDQGVVLVIGANKGVGFHAPRHLARAKVNLFGVVAMTNAFLPLLGRSSAGRVSSGLGTIALLADPTSPLRHYAALLGYNGSKTALNAATLMDEGGANVARQVDFTDACPHGVFCREGGGTYRARRPDRAAGGGLPLRDRTEAD